MRFILLLLMLIILVPNLYGGEQTSNIDEAKQLSDKLGKPILIDFMTDW